MTTRLVLLAALAGPARGAVPPVLTSLQLPSSSTGSKSSCRSQFHKCTKDFCEPLDDSDFQGCVVKQCITDFTQCTTASSSGKSFNLLVATNPTGRGGALGAVAAGLNPAHDAIAIARSVTHQPPPPPPPPPPPLEALGEPDMGGEDEDLPESSEFEEDESPAPPAPEPPAPEPPAAAPETPAPAPPAPEPPAPEPPAPEPPAPAPEPPDAASESPSPLSPPPPLPPDEKDTTSNGQYQQKPQPASNPSEQQEREQQNKQPSTSTNDPTPAPAASLEQEHNSQQSAPNPTPVITNDAHESKTLQSASSVTTARVSIRTNTHHQPSPPPSPPPPSSPPPSSPPPSSPPPPPSPPPLPPDTVTTYTKTISIDIRLDSNASRNRDEEGCLRVTQEFTDFMKTHSCDAFEEVAPTPTPEGRRRGEETRVSRGSAYFI